MSVKRPDKTGLLLNLKRRDKMEGMLSPADVAVLSGNASGNRQGSQGGFGDGYGWWIIILIVLLGWGRNGFGGNNGGGNSDGANYYYGGGFGMPNIYGKLDGITYGISDATFALNNSITNGFANVQSTLCQGFAGVNNAITVNGYETRNAVTDLGYRLQDCCCQTQRAIDKCCCETQRSIDNVRFDLSQLGCGLNNTINNSTRDILESNNANTRAILDFLTKDKIDTLQAENQALRFQASQSAQNNFIAANQDAQTAELIRRLGADCPVNAVVVQPNTPVTFPTNCCGGFSGFYNQGANNNCGCGCY